VYPTDLLSSETEHHLLRESDADFEERGKAFADGEYGWAKLMGELQLKAFQKQYGMSGVACRIFTAYGERENETHAVIALIAKAVARLDPFPIWGNGEQTRNFTYVLDTVTGLALGGARLDGFDTINVGTSKHQTILELIEQIFSFIEWRPSEILRELDRPVGVKSRAADNEKSDKLLGWSSSIDLPEGVARTVDWYVRNVEHRSGAELESLLLER
jgi:UDP-glucose 4-epimerase